MVVVVVVVVLGLDRAAQDRQSINCRNEILFGREIELRYEAEKDQQEREKKNGWRDVCSRVELSVTCLAGQA